MRNDQKKPLAHEDTRRRYLNERRAPAPGRFQHFTPEQEAEHLRQVAEAQAKGDVPF